MRSYTVVFRLNGRWERALLFSEREAAQYAAAVRCWPNVLHVYTVIR